MGFAPAGMLWAEMAEDMRNTPRIETPKFWFLLIFLPDRFSRAPIVAEDAINVTILPANESADLITNSYAGWLENHHTPVSFWNNRNSAGRDADFHRHFHATRTNQRATPPPHAGELVKFSQPSVGKRRYRNLLGDAAQLFE